MTNAPKTSNAGKAPRQSNFELLRIVAMFLIVAAHYVYETDWDLASASAFNRAAMNFINMFGGFGINIFAMASGYFLVKSRFTWRKFAIFVLTVWFYNWISLFVVSGFDVAYFINAIRPGDVFPVILGRYWYARAYAILLILSPFISKALLTMSRAEMARMLGLFLLIWSVIPTVLGALTGNDVEGILFFNRFIWIVVLFCMGAFLRLHGPSLTAGATTAASSVTGEAKSTGAAASSAGDAGASSYERLLMRFLSHGAGFYARCLAALFLALIAFLLLAELNPQVVAMVGMDGMYFLPPNSLAEVANSIVAFLFFWRIDIGSRPLLNKVASTTFGIYLFHSGHLKVIFWHSVFDTASHVSSTFLVGHIFLAATIVFAIGVAFDLVRQVLEKQLFRGIDALAARRRR